RSSQAPTPGDEPRGSCPARSAEFPRRASNFGSDPTCVIGLRLELVIIPKHDPHRRDHEEQFTLLPPRKISPWQSFPTSKSVMYRSEFTFRHSPFTISAPISFPFINSSGKNDNFFVFMNSSRALFFALCFQ